MPLLSIFIIIFLFIFSFYGNTFYGISPYILDSLNILTYKDLQLNQDTKQVTKNWKIINLTPKEFKILQELMLNKWKVVSKEDLLVSIRGYNNDIYSDVIRTHIKSLRDKIWQEYIKTVRWMWFILEE